MDAETLWFVIGEKSTICHLRRGRKGTKCGRRISRRIPFADVAHYRPCAVCRRVVERDEFSPMLPTRADVGRARRLVHRPFGISEWLMIAALSGLLLLTLFA